MSRIYDDQKLKNLPLITKLWSSVWTPGTWTRDGTGVLLEGIIQSRHRVCISDKSQEKTRYLLLKVKPIRAHRRKFDASGIEIEPNFSETTKVSTGYLNSSYKVAAKGTTDFLSNQELFSLITKPDLDAVTKEFSGPDSVLLWLPEAFTENLEIECETSFRFKTQGNSPFVASLTRMEGHWSSVSNYSGGEAVGGSWTDKVLAAKASSVESSDKAGDDVIGDDEWDD